MRLVLSVTALLLFAVSDLFAACGVERWSVKTGTDPQAPSVNLSSYISSTIYNFHQSTRPASLPSNGRVSPRETTQYRLSGTLTKYVRENDSDYHLVIKDGSGRTMIIELPASNCVGGGSPFGPGITRARNQFDARFTATTSFKTTSTPVTIKGVGFWDYIHGQTGVAPNGIEVHPVLDIVFGSSAMSPSLDGEEGSEATEPTEAGPEEFVAQMPVPVDSVRDDDGGLVQVYRGGDPVGDVLFHGGPVLEDPSIHILHAGGSAREMTAMVRGIDRDERLQELDRYGVRNFGLRVGARQLRLEGPDVSDLDIQRALLGQVEAGAIQHVDPNAVYIVILDSAVNAKVGQTTDWLSYHSQFHPTELPMRYVVVRGGLERDQQRQAMFGSLARTLINPAGDGWF